MYIDTIIRLEIRIIVKSEEANKALKVLRKLLMICKIISQLAHVSNFRFELNR